MKKKREGIEEGEWLFIFTSVFFNVERPGARYVNSQYIPLCFDFVVPFHLLAWIWGNMTIGQGAGARRGSPVLAPHMSHPIYVENTTAQFDHTWTLRKLPHPRNHLRYGNLPIS